MNQPDNDAWALQCSLRDWENLRTHVLFVHDSILPAGTVDGDFQRHGEYGAWLLRSGSGRIDVGNEHAIASPGRWLFCFADVLHQSVSPDARLLSVRVASAWPDGEPLFRGRTFVQVDAAAHPRLEQLAMAMRHALGEVAPRPEHPSFTFLRRTRVDYEGYTRYQHHLTEWDILTARIFREHGVSMRVPAGIDPRLAAALHEIDHLPLNAPFPRDVEAVGGLSLGQLNRMCLRVAGQTLYAYWDNRRLARAKLMLRQPSASVKEIAYQLGFRQLSHFSAWFKRHEGASPRSFQTMT